MKRTLLTIAVIAVLVIPSRAQEKEEKIKKLETLEQKTEQVTPPDTVMPADEVIIEYPEEMPDEDTLWAEEEITELEGETDDDTMIRIGKKEVRIISDDDNTEILIEDYEDNPKNRRRAASFKGHLGGIEIGFNNYSSGQWGRNPEPVEDYLDLNTAKSTSFNIIAPAVSLGLTRHFGLVTTLGINFNNYRFDGNNSITTIEGGVVAPLYPDNGINYEKSKLTTVYGVLPVILELQLPVGNSNTLNLGAGFIGAVKLGSHTKVVYIDDGKQKEKANGDFSLNVLRYGVTARAGYEMIQVYGSCYLSQLFESGKGPELYPFEVGIALTIND
jgi:hypothetical protein